MGQILPSKSQISIISFDLHFAHFVLGFMLSTLNSWQHDKQICWRSLPIANSLSGFGWYTYLFRFNRVWPGFCGSRIYGLPSSHAPVSKPHSHIKVNDCAIRVVRPWGLACEPPSCMGERKIIAHQIHPRLDTGVQKRGFILANRGNWSDTRGPWGGLFAQGLLIRVTDLCVEIFVGHWGL